uniref:Uncharacterized protein n=1 Tax=Globodera rostochiensis TaxID=31243 RepID=A0A914H793_GLORO
MFNQFCAFDGLGGGRGMSCRRRHLVDAMNGVVWCLLMVRGGDGVGQGQPTCPTAVCSAKYNIYCRGQCSALFFRHRSVLAPASSEPLPILCRWRRGPGDWPCCESEDGGFQGRGGRGPNRN